jgi:uncharacterized membrane protein YkgB
MPMLDTRRDVAILGVFDPDRIERLAALARGVLRYGLIALLLFWGGLKFLEFEAQAIRPLVDHHPLMSWMPAVFGVRGTSAVIGVVEIAAALLMCLRRWRPDLAAVGALIATGTFVVTLSFLITTPGAFAPESPIGGFLMKDIGLLGAALATAADALAAAARSARR